MLKLLLFAILLFVAACNPRLWCERNYPPTPITQIETVIRDTTLYLPGATVYDTLSLTDTLIRTHTIVDSAGRAQLVWWKDSYGRLLVRCSRAPDTLYIPTVKTVKEKQTVVVTPPRSPTLPIFLKGLGIGCLLGAVGLWFARLVWQAALARSRLF